MSALGRPERLHGIAKAHIWVIGLILAVLALVPASPAYADSESFDYRTLIPNGSETSAALTAKQVTFNGASWYLTAYDDSAKTVTLFAAGQISTSRFDGSSSDYAGSEIQAYLDALTAEGGSYAAVAPAIASVDLDDVGVTGAKLYLLSEVELNTMPDNIRRVSADQAGWKNYWLRTKGPNTWFGTPQAKNCYPAAGVGTPLVGEAVVTDTSKLVRPALKLDLEKVDFNQTSKTFTLKEIISKTVTFSVVNGAWSDGTNANKTVTLTGYPGDLKLSADDIPSVGENPSLGYKAGSWDVTPSTETLISEDTTYTYTYAERQPVSFTVTFKVQNGSWNDGTSADKVITLSGLEGDELKLSSELIPNVGEKPAEGYVAGSWDVVPQPNMVVTKNLTYTYTYVEDGKISATVTFAVVNGAWGDSSTGNKTVVLEGDIDNLPKLTADQIPAVGENPADGYKAGAWDTEPSTETEISEDITYTYTYAAKQPISVTVTFKVVNGAWDNESTESKTVTLEGLEGDQLMLTDEDIPAVGTKPAEGYKAGAWDTEPDTETAIANNTTYTYTYVARELADDIKDLIPTEDESMDQVLTKRVNFNGFQWYVVAYDDENNTCTLFASEKIGNNSRFDIFSNVYKTSEIKTLLDSMVAEGGLFEGAAYNIKETNLTDINPYVENAKLFLLGTEEAKAVSVNARKYGEEYWLRSQPSVVPGGAVHVYNDVVRGPGTIGEISGSSVQLPKAVRPALKIDLSKTAFDKETQTFVTKQTVTAPKAAQDLAYTVEEQQLLASPVVVVRGNDAEDAIQYSLDGTTWSTEIPAATNPGDYTIYYKVAGNSDYDEFTCTEPLAVTIDKAEPEKPLVLAVYGQTLADTTMWLTEGWSWVNPNDSVGNAGKNTFPANYTSSDEFHKDMTNVSIDVLVGKASQDAPAAPTASSKTPTTITLTAIDNGEYKCGEGQWQDNPVFSGLVADTEYTFYQRLKEDSNHYASDASSAQISTSPKENQEAPAAPTAQETTMDSITLVAIENGQYKCGEGEWQDSPTFSGLNPGTEYTFYQRLAEDADHNASDSSEGAAITTESVDKTALIEAIDAAKAAEEGVKTSTDGKDVDAKDKWTTADEKKALDDAIKAAEEIANKVDATQAETDKALADIKAVTDAYEAAKKAGTKPVEPTTVKITKVTAANATYTGAASLPKPALSVTDASGKTVPASGYTATWVYNTGYGKQPAVGGKYVGTAKVTVVGKGAYTGSASATFKITTVADGTKVGAALNEKTVTAIEKLKSGSAAVPQASSKTMETIAKPRTKQMLVKWAAVKGATNYLVGYKRASAKEWSYVVSGGKTQYTFNNMKEGDLLEFRVAVYDGKKFARGEWTQINCRFMREMVSLKAKAGTGKIDLSWGKVAGATGYQILLGTKKDLSDAKIITVKGGSTVKTTITTIDGTPKGKALTKGKTYYLKVRAIKTAANANGKTNTYIGIQSLVRECKITGGTTALKS